MVKEKKIIDQIYHKQLQLLWTQMASEMKNHFLLIS